MVCLLASCLQEPERHHRGVFNKYGDRRYKKASHFVQAELRKGFMVPSLHYMVQSKPTSPVVEDFSDAMSFETRNSYKRMVQALA